jgi:hypothetical protein
LIFRKQAWKEKNIYISKMKKRKKGILAKKKAADADQAIYQNG